ncbi:hypothetical protein R1flu_007036 [Riccia fluitans]|uniref:Uncharacterized protein n=1 Tax=Riccia fluitans TaxID=41844 RepID=A0ABD1Z1U9_9MARC
MTAAGVAASVTSRAFTTAVGVPWEPVNLVEVLKYVSRPCLASNRHGFTTAGNKDSTEVGRCDQKCTPSGYSRSRSSVLGPAQKRERADTCLLVDFGSWRGGRKRSGGVGVGSGRGSRAARRLRSVHSPPSGVDSLPLRGVTSITLLQSGGSGWSHGGALCYTGVGTRD